jgi:chromosomal replication initiation ATPase DnaA
MQLALKFNHKNEYNVQDFFVTESNKAAYKAVCKFPEWDFFCLMLLGAQSSGKTHLAKIWQGISNAQEINLSEDFLSKLDANNNFIVEVTEALSEDEQKNLFYIYNYVRENNGFLLITSPFEVDDFCTIPDLKSRLKIATKAEILPPDDDLLKLLFSKSFSDRQMQVNPMIIDFLVKRVARSGLEVKKIIDYIENNFYSKPITLAKVKECLGEIPQA